MTFSTYINSDAYLEPQPADILEPSPVGMAKLQTPRYETEYQPLLAQYLDQQGRMREDFNMDRDPAYNIAFLAVAALGIFYVYTFVRMLMR